MDDFELELYRYVIQVQGPPILKPQGEGDRLFNTNDYAGGWVHVYRTAEGTTPSISAEVRHLLYVGAFPLQEKPNKTAEEFMREVKEGLVKLVKKE
ncbi:MAG TPA: hypothetical protein VMC07_01865 [Candidatus Omnitrophota bacterium]|nr:hypothetical protein [Candidatus Omnitrophota bacterium]